MSGKETEEFIFCNDPVCETDKLVKAYQALGAENKTLQAELKKYQKWGTDRCGNCESGRVTLYYYGDGCCYSCKQRKEKSI